MHQEFPDEDIMALFEEEGEDEDKEKWIVWFDGASNVLGHRIKVVLVSEQQSTLGLSCSNNMAEYEACALGI